MGKLKIVLLEMYGLIHIISAMFSRIQLSQVHFKE